MLSNCKTTGHAYVSCAVNEVSQPKIIHFLCFSQAAFRDLQTCYTHHTTSGPVALSFLSVCLSLMNETGSLLTTKWSSYMMLWFTFSVYLRFAMQ